MKNKNITIISDRRLVIQTFLSPSPSSDFGSAWRIQCHGWEHACVVEVLIVQHEVQCELCNSIFVLSKCSEWWEKWKPVVTQVCRQCCCSCSVFYFLYPITPDDPLPLKFSVWSLIPAYHLFSFLKKCSYSFSSEGWIVITCLCFRGHKCNLNVPECSTLLHITNRALDHDYNQFCLLPSLVRRSQWLAMIMN